MTNDLRATSSLRVIDRFRVVEAVKRAGGDLSALRAELHLDRAVVGSFQRAGDRLRITARVVDAASGEAMAEAKADGMLTQVFELQDGSSASSPTRSACLAARAGRGARSASRAASRRIRPLPRLGRAGVTRSVTRSCGNRGLRAGDRVRSAVRRRLRGARECAVLAIRDVAGAESARRRAPGACHRSRSPCD